MNRFAVTVAGSLLTAFTLACSDASPEPNTASLVFDDPHMVSAATQVGAAPILALAPDGRYATAWVSAPDGGSDGRLHILVTQDGESEAAAVSSELSDPLGPIEPHGEAPPKLAWAAHADGSLTLGALYVVGRVIPGRRFPASALRFVRSDDGGSTWSTPVTVTDDTTHDVAGGEDFGSHNFHALHAAPDGTFYVAWLDGRTGKSAVFMTRSADGGSTWMPNVRVVPGSSSFAESCPCCRTAIAADGKGTVFLAWRSVVTDSLGETIRDIVVSRSSDEGSTWSEPVVVHHDNWVFDGCPHAGPSLALDGAGRLHVAWWTGKPGAAGVYYTQSSNAAASFAEATALGVAEASQPAHVQLAVAGNAEKPSVFVTWDDGTKRLPQVSLRVSHNGGQSFDTITVVSAPGQVATFPVLVVTNDASSLTLAWSEQSAQAASEAPKRPDMKDPHASMQLPAVGNMQVMMRRARLSGTAASTPGSNVDAFTPLRPGDQVPAYAATSIAGARQGESLDIGEPGQVTLLNVWATWCTSCREEMADLDSLHRKYDGRGLRVVAVSVDQGDPGRVIGFAQREKLEMAIAHDPAGLVQQRFSVVGVPETYLIGKSGQVLWKVSGNVHASLGELESAIDAALATPAGPDPAAPVEPGVPDRMSSHGHQH